MALLNKKRSTEKSEKRDHSAVRTIVRGGSAVLLALSLITSMAFDDPADIYEDQAASHLDKAPIVMDADDFMNADADDDEDDNSGQSVAGDGILSRFRQKVMSFPAAVRLLIITPLWAAGTALMTLISFFWNVIFTSPLGAFIASFALGFAVLLGLYAVTAHMLFPDIPLKDLLSKRNILILAAAALVLSGLDAVMPLFWNKYPALAALVKLAFGGAAIGLLSLRAKALFQNKLLSLK